jgi:hypothetical protein
MPYGTIDPKGHGGGDNNAIYLIATPALATSINLLVTFRQD